MTLIIPVCSKLAVLSSGNPKIHIQYFLFAGSHDPHANVVKIRQSFKCRLSFLQKSGTVIYHTGNRYRQAPRTHIINNSPHSNEWRNSDAYIPRVLFLPSWEGIKIGGFVVPGILRFTFSIFYFQKATRPLCKSRKNTANHQVRTVLFFHRQRNGNSI